MKSVPPRGKRVGLATHHSSCAASRTHPLPRGGTDFMNRVKCDCEQGSSRHCVVALTCSIGHLNLGDNGLHLSLSLNLARPPAPLWPSLVPAGVVRSLLGRPVSAI